MFYTMIYQAVNSRYVNSECTEVLLNGNLASLVWCNAHWVKFIINKKYDFVTSKIYCVADSVLLFSIYPKKYCHLILKE